MWSDSVYLLLALVTLAALCLSEPFDHLIELLLEFVFRFYQAFVNLLLVELRIILKIPN